MRSAITSAGTRTTSRSAAWPERGLRRAPRSLDGLERRLQIVVVGHHGDRAGQVLAREVLLVHGHVQQAALLQDLNTVRVGAQAVVEHLQRLIELAEVLVASREEQIAVHALRTDLELAACAVDLALVRGEPLEDLHVLL